MRFSILFSIALMATTAFAQVTGGQSAFSYLQTANSAKIAAIGGDNVSSFGDDPSMVYQNPALLNDEMANKTVTNITFYKSGTKLNSAQYVFKKSKIGVFSAGLTYLNYGIMTRRDIGGANQGEFFANDFVLHGSKSFRQDNFSIGFTPKVAFSQIEKYNAMALATDVGGTFNHPNNNFTVGMTIENIGFAVKNYTNVKNKLPFNVSAGFSIKPEHMPLKISVTAHHLHEFDIYYDDPTQRDENLFNDTVEYKKPIGGMILRHFTVGGEFIISDHLNFRMGYNFQRRRELTMDSKSGGAGFSFGVMVKTKFAQIDLTKVYNNYAGRPVYLTLILDFDNFIKKQEINTEEEIL